MEIHWRASEDWCALCEHAAAAGGQCVGEIRLECAKDEQSEVQLDAEGHWHVYRY